MKNVVILHIPHSSLKLTKEFKMAKKLLSCSQIKKFNQTITDLYTHQLFSCKRFKCIKFKYSRICCDVEKFADSKKEPMAKFGLGVIYTKTHTGKTLLNVSNNYKQCVLKKYYHPHHNRLNNIVNKYLQQNKKVILIDCHSFSKQIILTSLAQNLPDICIGYNQNLNDHLPQQTNEYFKNLGYKTAFNYPYFGSMVPNSLINNANNNFNTIMLEINKNTYLNGNKKTKNFSKLKKDILNYLKFIVNL